MYKCRGCKQIFKSAKGFRHFASPKNSERGWLCEDCSPKFPESGYGNRTDRYKDIVHPLQVGVGDFMTEFTKFLAEYKIQQPNHVSELTQDIDKILTETIPEIVNEGKQKSWERVDNFGVKNHDRIRRIRAKNETFIN